MSIVDERVEPTGTDQGMANQGHVSTIDLTQPPANRPTFTITDAATACAVSRKTITRKLADLAAHGASKDDDGIWRIPVEALLAVGLHPGRSLPRDSSPTAARPAPAPVVSPPAAAPTVGAPAPAAGPDLVTITRERWDDVRLRLARAEAEASERAAALADARLALRALTAGPASPAAPPPAPAPSVETGESAVAAPPARRRRWWQAKDQGDMSLGR